MTDKKMDMKDCEDKPVDFSSKEGLKEAADFCFGPHLADSGHFQIAGMTYDVDPVKGLSSAMLAFVRGIYTQ